jgi:hypothetical protein
MKRIITAGLLALSMGFPSFAAITHVPLENKVSFVNFETIHEVLRELKKHSFKEIIEKIKKGEIKIEDSTAEV